LQDGDLALLSREGVHLFSIETGRPIERKTTYLPWDALQAEKAGYRHFMLKEIFEQPRSLEDTLRGRLDINELKVHLDTLKLSEDQIQEVSENDHCGLRDVVPRGAHGPLPF
jgi:glucosamine--fructose-6-phosphate aminotransferase (isomerizing)